MSLLVGLSIIFSFFGSLESFAFEECGQYGLFFYSDGYCHFFRLSSPPTRTGGCPGFNPGTFKPSNRLQGIVMEKGGSSYFWSGWQRKEVIYHVMSYQSDRAEERKFPGKFSATSVRMFITLSGMFLATSDSGEFYVNGIEFDAMNGRKLLDVVSIPESSSVLILVQENDTFQFIYTNNDTSKSGTITIELPENRAIGTIVTDPQICGEQKFFLIQDQISKQLQIYVYSVPGVIKAAEQESNSYPIDLSYSITFESTLKIDSCHPIMIRYPYKSRAFMITLTDQANWYLVIPNITYSDHNFTNCRFQNEKNGARMAICSRNTSRKFYVYSPFVKSGRLGIHTVFKDLSGSSAKFEFQNLNVTTCFLMNDCYGCRLASLNDQSCTWNGRECLQSDTQKAIEKCLSITKMTDNNGKLEVHVKGVRLTNTFMRVCILSPKGKIMPTTVRDHEATFQVDNIMIKDCKAGKIDLFFQVDDDIIENRPVRLELQESTEPESSYSHLILWIIIIILVTVVILFIAYIILPHRKVAKTKEEIAPPGSLIDSLISSKKPEDLLKSHTPKKLAKISDLAREKGIETPSEISKSKGFKPPAKGTPIWSGEWKYSP